MSADGAPCHARRAAGARVQRQAVEQRLARAYRAAVSPLGRYVLSGETFLSFLLSLSPLSCGLLRATVIAHHVRRNALGSAMVAFSSVLVALLNDLDFIAVGNEKSANFGNTTYLGTAPHLQRALLP